MVGRKYKNSVDLDKAREQINQVKALVISSGLPYAWARTMDDALSVINNLEERTNNK